MLIGVGEVCVYLRIANAILPEVAPQHFSEADADITVISWRPKFHSMMPDDDDGTDVSASPPAAAYLW